MAKIHVIMQGKGGVGKSLISNFIAQYKMHKGQTPLCIDTDCVNTTFHDFKTLDVRRLEIMKENIIDARKFDEMMEMIGASTEDVVIDNGASSFVPLFHYMINHDVPGLLHDMNHTLVIHTVVVGGQSILDTVQGFSQLAAQFQEKADFVVWLNPYWGTIEHDGKVFEQFKTYIEHKEKISALIHMQKLQAETFGYDFTAMLKEKLTFQEALNCTKRGIMAKQRLKMIRDRLFVQLDSAMI